MPTDGLAKLRHYLPLGVLLAGGTGLYLADRDSLFTPQDGGPSVGENFITAHYRGTRPMTRPMRGFMEYYPREKFGGATGPTKLEKTAAGFFGKGFFSRVPGMFGDISDAVSNVLGNNRQREAFEQGIDQISQNLAAGGQSAEDIAKMVNVINKHKPGAAWKSVVPMAAAGTALMAADPVLDFASDTLTPYIETKGYQMSRERQDLFSRAKMDEMAAESFAKTLGSEAAKGLAGAVGGVFGDVPHVIAKPIQTRMVHNLLESDPILSQASLQQQQMMSDAYESMRSVAPTVARDQFAVKNFLREVMVTGNGPDHATLGNLARTEQTLRGE